MDYYSFYNLYKVLFMSEENKNTQNTDVLREIQKTQDLYIDNKNNDFVFLNSVYREGKLQFANGGVWGSVGNNNTVGVTAYFKPAEESNFTHLRAMIKTLQEVYPDKWNLELHYDRNTGKVVVLGFSIHFAKMNIVNRDGGSHVLRDTYSFSPLILNSNKGNKFLMVDNMFLTRLTVTEAENSVNYFHSHQTGYSINNHSDFSRESNHLRNFHSMCLGDHTQGIVRACSDFKQDPSTDAFINVLLNIKATIRYESLEGGPHRYIRDISRSSNSARRVPAIFANSLSNSTVDQLGVFLLKFALKEDPNLLLRFDLQYHPFLNKTLTFQDNLKLEQILVNSFRKLVEIAPDQASQIVLEQRSTNNIQTFNIDTISKLFSHIKGHNNKDSFISTDLFYIPEITGDGIVPTGDTVIQVYNSPFMFRGELRTAKIVRSASDSPENLKKLDPKVIDIKLSPTYFNIIRQTLIQKLTKNVFIQQEEKSEA